MKKRILALALALSLLLSACGGGGNATATTMHLRKTEGTVGVSDGEGKSLTPAENLGLYSGYGVDTKGSSYAWIDLDDVKLTKMDENSQVEIKKEDKHLNIEVKTGSLFFNVTEPLGEDETLDIRTSTMLVGIRGTCGWVTQDSAALLEGTVECTAGENTVTITAGEMAILTDGTLEVKPFTAESVPAFVREEDVKDEKLAETIPETTPEPEEAQPPEADPMNVYVDVLATIEEDREIFYTEIIDFEQDGDPELLVISMGEEINYIDFYRNGTDGPVRLGEVGRGSIGVSAISYSLVESNGKLFVCNVLEYQGRVHSNFYYGHIARENGGRGYWREVDGWNISLGVLEHSEIGSTNGTWTKEADDIRDKYTHVRDLARYEVENVT